jgi:hypothetical protein
MYHFDGMQVLQVVLPHSRGVIRQMADDRGLVPNRQLFGGSHIRPRIKVPDSFNLPVGLSLGSEIGYQRLGFFNNHWLIEIHPIIDKEIGGRRFAF